MDRERKCRLRCALGLALITGLTATDGFAGGRDHADGLFLRLAPGYGQAVSTLALPGQKVELSGATAAADVAVGVVISEDLVLHGTFCGSLMQDADVQHNATRSQLDGDVLGTAYGIGLTRYFMPDNVYLSASGGLGRYELDLAGGRSTTDYGPFFTFSVGKEWWLGPSWGIGIAGGVQYHDYGDPDVDANWSGLTYNMRLTTTLN